MISSTLNKYHINKEVNNQKVKDGVTVEPQHGAFPENEEAKHEEVVLVQKLTLEQTQE